LPQHEVEEIKAIKEAIAIKLDNYILALAGLPVVDKSESDHYL
jgi:NifB/MoaA-like Fe-S oxidoreductase